MPKSAESLQPLGWIVPPELPNDLRYVQVLALPKPIYDSLNSLEKSLDRVPPITSLHDALAAHSSAIIAFEPKALSFENIKRHWLYALSNLLDSSRLQPFLRAWLTACYGADRAKSVVESWGTCYWDTTTIDLQTADEDLKKLLLPGLIARWLKEQGFQLTLKGQAGKNELPLHLVQLMTQRNTIELISDPQSYGDEIGSFVLHFWLENRPKTGELCLLHRLSVRRWMNRPLISDKGYVSGLTYRRNKSVYLQDATRYLDRVQPINVFSRIRLRCINFSEDPVRWVGQQAEMLNQLRLEPMPSAVELARDPAAYTSQLLVTRDNQNQEQQGRRVSLGTGLYANDHRQGFHDLSACLGPIFKPLPECSRVEAGDASAWGGRTHSQRAIRDAKPEIRWEALRHLPYSLRIELHVDDVATAQRELLEIVGAPTAAARQDNHTLYVMDGTRPVLEIITGSDSELTQPLEAGNAGNLGERTSKRRVEVANRYSKTDQSTGALIVLSDYRKKKKKADQTRDPKQAIRLGLIDSGRVSQFMVPKGDYPNDTKMPKEGHKNGYALRVEQAARDLLRALGYRYNPFYMPSSKLALPEQVDLLAFYVIQLNARNRSEETIQLPLMIEAPFGHPHMCITLPTITGRPQVYTSLREGMIAAAQLEQNYAGISPEAFFRDALAKRVSRRPTLLLLAEQNLRRVFAELDNQRGVGQISLNGVLDHAPLIRVARLRQSAHFEAPFCVSAEKKSRYQGLYQSELPTVFYSVHDLERKSWTEDYKQDKPREAAVTPSALQIWMNNVPADEDPALWAALVHRLRLESSHTDIATILPQPIHDAKKISEYLRYAVVEVDEPDETDEED